MRLAEHVPMMNAEERGIHTDGGELHFCSLAEAYRNFFSRTAGKVLTVTDRSAYRAVCALSADPRAITVVLDGADALPLFSAPEGIGAVFAAGGKETLSAARFYSRLRSVPCSVLPSDAACFGVFGEMGSVFLDGERTDVLLAQAEIFCDVSLLEGSLPSARARIALSALARFEARALGVFSRPVTAPVCVRVARDAPPEEIVRANAALRRSEAAGAWRGEGATLASAYPEEAPQRAYFELSALYSAFFLKGRPRKYAVADYAARAKRAGVRYADLSVPSAEEYAHRALRFEHRRAELSRELDLILRENQWISDSVCAVSLRERGVRDSALMRLPELCPGGLCAVIRDFGLMERS